MNQKGKKRGRDPRQLFALVITVVIVITSVAGLVISNIDPQTGDDNLDARYQGIARGVNEDGLPVLGDPGAPVLVHEISDFTCGHCGTFHDEVFPLLLDEHIKDGGAQLVFVPAVSNRTGSEQSTRAAFCALEQGRFWEMHDWLFGFHGYGYTEAGLLEAVEALGMDTKLFLACMVGPEAETGLRRAEAFIDVKRAEGAFTGTPTIYINGEQLASWRSVVSAVNAALQR